MLAVPVTAPVYYLIIIAYLETALEVRDVALRRYGQDLLLYYRNRGETLATYITYFSVQPEAAVENKARAKKNTFYPEPIRGLWLFFFVHVVATGEHHVSGLYEMM